MDLKMLKLLLLLLLLSPSSLVSAQSLLQQAANAVNGENSLLRGMRQVNKRGGGGCCLDIQEKEGVARATSTGC